MSNKALWLLFGVIVLTLYRAWVVMTNGLPLYVDEAQYWYWAQQLDWGYFSKPPVIAVVIAATTSVCGDSEFCVRAGSLLFYPLSTGVLFLLARRLFDQQVAVVAALLFITLPAVGLSSTLISTDVVLFFCWTLALYLLVRALESDRWSDWLALGVALGLGMMTKYTMGVFFVSALLYLLSSGRWRVLLNGRAWSAVLLAALLFAPNLWWNWQHDFPTFQHTADISNLEQAGWHWSQLAEFIGGQLLVFGCLLFPLLLLVIARLATGLRLPHAGLLLSFTLPFLLIICLQALLGRANANWAAPTYVAGTLLVAAWLVYGQYRRLLWAALIVNGVLWLGLYHFERLTPLFGVELNAKNDVYKRLRGWDELGEQYRALLAQYPDAIPLAEERGILSEMVYYARPAGLAMVSWNPEGVVRHHYDLVTTLADKQGRDFLYLAEGDHLPDHVAAYFGHATTVGELLVVVYPGFERRYAVYFLQEFKGMTP